MNLTMTFNDIVKYHNQHRRLPLSQLSKLEDGIHDKLTRLAVVTEASEFIELTTLANKLNSTTLVDFALYKSEPERNRFRELLSSIDKETP